ncbi:hypothetical protein NDU88_007213 [Pleurodeles waltl]|uniref:Uncharacterized protein n=1 Tax=Pleurodeles waltl TaxID=8319 RepID=A0AAV7SS84_PLEWA|nr:hypothetical protein NDU88_007213 [Pleurodeles waltl]
MKHFLVVPKLETDVVLDFPRDFLCHDVMTCGCAASQRNPKMFYLRCFQYKRDLCLRVSKRNRLFFRYQ